MELCKKNVHSYFMIASQIGQAQSESILILQIFSNEISLRRSGQVTHMKPTNSDIMGRSTSSFIKCMVDGSAMYE